MSLVPAFAWAIVPIVAHRGASADAPENTMAAFDLAWQQGADAIETDLWLTKDDRIVCMHDGNAKRTTGVDQDLSSMTLNDVRKLDAGRWKGEPFAGQGVPLFDDVLASVPVGKQFFIEIKSGPEILPAFERAMEKYRSRWGDFRVISFKPDVIAAVKQAVPELKAFWLTSFKPDDSGVARPTAAEVLATLGRIHADGLDAKADLKQLDAAFVAALRAGGYALHVWTVDDPRVAKEVIARGAESVTTNKPAFLRKVL